MMKLEIENNSSHTDQQNLPKMNISDEFSLSEGVGFRGPDQDYFASFMSPVKHRSFGPFDAEDIYHETSNRHNTNMLNLPSKNSVNAFIPLGPSSNDGFINPNPQHYASPIKMMESPPLQSPHQAHGYYKNTIDQAPQMVPRHFTSNRLRNGHSSFNTQQRSIQRASSQRHRRTTPHQHEQPQQQHHFRTQQHQRNCSPIINDSRYNSSPMSNLNSHQIEDNGHIVAAKNRTNNTNDERTTPSSSQHKNSTFIEDHFNCSVCGDVANGIHYGAISCEGCKGFFRRAIIREHQHECQLDGQCEITPTSRGKCAACRFAKCQRVGMSIGSIKLGRRSNKQKMSLLQATSKGFKKCSSTILYGNDFTDNSNRTIFDENGNPNLKEYHTQNYLKSQQVCRHSSANLDNGEVDRYIPSFSSPIHQPHHQNSSMRRSQSSLIAPTVSSDSNRFMHLNMPSQNPYNHQQHFTDSPNQRDLITHNRQIETPSITPTSLSITTTPTTFPYGVTNDLFNMSFPQSSRGVEQYANNFKLYMLSEIPSPKIESQQRPSYSQESVTNGFGAASSDNSLPSMGSISKKLLDILNANEKNQGSMSDSDIFHLRRQFWECLCSYMKVILYRLGNFISSFDTFKSLDDDVQLALFKSNWLISMIFTLLYLVDEDSNSLSFNNFKITFSEILSLFPIGTQENDFIVCILNFIKMLTLPKNNVAYYGLSIYLSMMNKSNLDIKSSEIVSQHFREAEKLFSELNYMPVQFTFLCQFQNWFESLLISAKDFYKFEMPIKSIFFPPELYGNDEDTANNKPQIKTNGAVKANTLEELPKSIANAQIANDDASTPLKTSIGMANGSNTVETYCCSENGTAGLNTNDTSTASFILNSDI